MTLKLFLLPFAILFILGCPENLSAQDVFGTQFRHTVSQSNTTGIHTYLDNEELNNHPEAIIIASPTLEPNQIPVADNFTLIYNTDSAKWAIRNADGINSFPMGSTFNVLIPSSGGTAFRAIAPGGSDDFILDNPAVNGLSEVKVFINPIYPGYNIGNGNGQFVTSYLPGNVNRWAISSIQQIDAGATFNVFVPYQSANVFVHRVTAPNQSTSVTEIDNPLLNGHPEINFLFQRQFKFSNETNTTFNNRKKSAAYFDGKWHIKIDDGNYFYHNEDYSIAILNNFPNGVTSKLNDDTNLLVYPNPADRVLRIVMGRHIISEEKIEYEIVNLFGQIIRDETIFPEPTVEIDIKSIPDGTYFLKLISENELIVQKFIVIH